MEGGKMNRGMFDLEGKVALITAGGHGLGREYCRAMAEYGAKVVCSDIDMDLAHETVRLLNGEGKKAIAVQADVSKPEDVRRAVNEALSSFGTIDILFCNAGIVSPFVPLHELAIEDWDKVVAVNLRGTFLFIREAIKVMLKQKRGSIISTASVAGVMAGHAPDSVPYGATKAAIINMTRHIAVAYANQGIRINAIAPGLHDTKPVGLGIPPEKQEELKEMISKFIPMGRFGEPSEIRGHAKIKIHNVGPTVSH